MKRKILSSLSAPFTSKRGRLVLCYTAFLALGASLIVKLGVAQTSVFALSMLVHEGCHLLSALLLGIKVSSVAPSLFGFRIAAQNSQLQGAKALLLYMSGPFGNVLFAMGAIVVSFLMYTPNLAFFVFYNILIACINMLPAYPLDAARALEGLLAAWRGKGEAVRIACYVSYVTALVLFSLGLYLFVFSTDNMLLMLVAIFVFVSTKKELEAAQMDFLLKSATGLAGRGKPYRR